jgi:hypothetical protein
MQFVANAIVGIAPTPPRAAAAQMLAAAAPDFQHVLLSALGEASVVPPEALLGASPSIGAFHSAAPTTQSQQISPDPLRNAAVDKPATPRPAFFSLPQHAAAAAHAPAWTPPGAIRPEAETTTVSLLHRTNPPQHSASSVVSVGVNETIQPPAPLVTAKSTAAPEAPIAPSFSLSPQPEAVPIASALTAAVESAAATASPESVPIAPANAATTSPPEQLTALTTTLSNDASTSVFPVAPGPAPNLKPSAEPSNAAYTSERPSRGGVALPVPMTAPLEAQAPRAMPASTAETRDAPHGEERPLTPTRPAPPQHAANGFAQAVTTAAKEVAPSSAGSDLAAQLQPASTPSNASQVMQAAGIEHAARAAPAVVQVAREIVRRFDGTSTRFELRLDPPELGRVDVRLEVTRDHRVTASVAADSQQALTELVRHARDLEQTLQSAGLQLSEQGLSFDLRRSNAGAEDRGTSAAADSASDGEDDTPAALSARPVGFERWRGVRLDVMV